MSESFKIGDEVIIHRTEIADKIPGIWVASMDAYEGKIDRILRQYIHDCWVLEKGDIWVWHEDFLTLVSDQDKKMIIIDTIAAPPEQSKAEPAFDFDTYYGIRR